MTRTHLQETMTRTSYFITSSLEIVTENSGNTASNLAEGRNLDSFHPNSGPLTTTKLKNKPKFSALLAMVSN
jgi:hypothetical protein